MIIKINKSQPTIYFEDLLTFALFVDAEAKALMIKTDSFNAMSLHTTKTWPYSKQLVHPIKTITVEV